MNCLTIVVTLKCNIRESNCNLFTGFPLKWRMQILRLFQHHKHQKIRPTVLPLTTFYVVLIFFKRGSENVTWNSFCWFIKIIIIINAGKLNRKNYSITYLVFQEHTSQIQDFFSTSVQFQDFSGPEKSKLKFQDFSGTVGTLLEPTVSWHVVNSGQDPPPSRCPPSNKQTNCQLLQKYRTSSSFR